MYDNPPSFADPLGNQAINRGGGSGTEPTGGTDWLTGIKTSLPEETSKEQHPAVKTIVAGLQTLVRIAQKSAQTARLYRSLESSRTQPGSVSAHKKVVITPSRQNVKANSGYCTGSTQNATTTPYVPPGSVRPSVSGQRAAESTASTAGSMATTTAPWYLTPCGKGGSILTFGLGNIKLPVIEGRWEIGPLDPNRAIDQGGRFFTNGLNAAWNAVATAWNTTMDGTAPSTNDVLNNISQTSWEDIGNAATDIRTYENLTGDVILFLLAKKVSFGKSGTGGVGTTEGIAATVGVETVTAASVDAVNWVRVGRWMSKEEYAIMKETQRVVEGAGGQTFISVNGVEDYMGAARVGSVYVEFEVPQNSLLQGGKEGWFKMIGPSASNSQKFMLNKQGDEMLPEVKNLSEIIQVKSINEN